MLGPKVAGLQMRPAIRPTGISLSRRRSADLLHRPEHASIERAHMFPSAVGNQATLRRLAQRSENPARVSGYQPDLALATSSLSGAIQPKLAVGSVDDPLEHEADHVADQVMRMPDPAISLGAAPPLLSRKCATCEAEESALQRKSGAPQASGGAAAPGVVHQVLGSPGRSLDAQTRAFFEPRFGRGFGDVRVHADPAAAASARSVGALAYTAGSHVVFGAAQYSPQTIGGRRLLAHELAHVVQQSGGMGRETIRRQPPAGSAAPATPEKVCPATYQMPDDAYVALDTAWKASGQGGDTVTEQGGRIVTDASGKRAIHTGSGAGGEINLPEAAAGETTVGTFHTHPYSKSEGSHLGVSFSGGDITNFVAGDQGGVKYVGAGSCNYVLNTLDQTKRDACKTQDLTKRWNDGFAKASGDFPSKVETAVKATIAGCGLCYYKACRPNATSPVPKAASLA